MIDHYIIETFSNEWWITTSLTIITIIFFIFLGRIYKSDYNSKLTKFIGIVMILRIIFTHAYLYFYLDIWSLQSSLPLHLCGLSAILAGILMFWSNQVAYECLFYWGICGAFHSLLTPEFTNGIQGLLYYEYYISHGGIILSALFLTFVIGMRPRKYSWLKIFIYSQILIPIIGLVNLGLDSNYLYLCSPPDAKNPIIDFIREKPFIIYICFIDFIALIHFYIIYSLFNICTSKKTVA